MFLSTANNGSSLLRAGSQENHEGSWAIGL